MTKAAFKEDFLEVKNNPRFKTSDPLVLTRTSKHMTRIRHNLGFKNMLLYLEYTNYLYLWYV